MPAFNYARSRRTADRLITRFGSIGAIRRGGGTSGGDSTNSQPSTGGSDGEPQDFPATLVIVDYSEQERNGTLVRQTDRKALIATKGLMIEPTNSDLLVVDGDEYAIINVMPLKPGPIVVLYEAQVRR